MRIPKKIQYLIERREKLVLELINVYLLREENHASEYYEVTNKVFSWLKENGADLTDRTLTDYLIYCDPRIERMNDKEAYIKSVTNHLKDYIKNKM